MATKQIAKESVKEGFSWGIVLAVAILGVLTGIQAVLPAIYDLNPDILGPVVFVAATVFVTTLIGFIRAHLVEYGYLSK